MAAIPKRAASLLEAALVMRHYVPESGGRRRGWKTISPRSHARIGRDTGWWCAPGKLKYGLDLADGKPLRLAGQAGLASWQKKLN